MTPLAFVASVHYRRESTILRRFGRDAEAIMAALLGAGFVDLHSLEPRSYHVTMLGRAELRRARAGESGRRAAA